VCVQNPRSAKPLQERRDTSLSFVMSTPIRRIRSGCCARAASGHAAADPAITLMKSRRLM
jgi:hypothetical protein